MSWHQAGLREFKNPQEVASVLRSQVTQGRGIYALPLLKPAMPQETQTQKMARLAQHAESMDKGPYLYAVVRPGRQFGAQPQWGILLLRSLLLSLALALLIHILMMPRLAQWGCCSAFGTLSALTTLSSSAIWREWPWYDVMVCMGDHTIECTLVGGLLAALLGRPMTVHDRH